ncbi:uncharacterized protein LOC144936889 isoform X1 [Lampetra fluviatilis]
MITSASRGVEASGVGADVDTNDVATDTAMKSKTCSPRGIALPSKFKAIGQKRPLYHVPAKRMDVTNKAKTTEEMELEKIKQLQLELKRHREMAQKSLRMVQHSSVHMPLKSTCMPTFPVGFNFHTDGRIKRHAMQQPSLGATQSTDKTHRRSKNSIAAAKSLQQVMSSRLAGGLPVLKRKREGGDAGVASNSCMSTRLKSRMTAPQTSEPNVKKLKTDATSQRNAPRKVQSVQPLAKRACVRKTTNSRSTVSRGEENARPAPSTRHPVIPVTKAGQPGGSRPPPRPLGLHCLNWETKSRAGPTGKSAAKIAPADKLQSKVHKANPVRRYKKLEVMGSDKPLTSPVSPKFSTRFNK